MPRKRDVWRTEFKLRAAVSVLSCEREPDHRERVQLALLELVLRLVQRFLALTAQSRSQEQVSTSTHACPATWRSYEPASDRASSRRRCRQRQQLLSDTSPPCARLSRRQCLQSTCHQDTCAPRRSPARLRAARWTSSHHRTVETSDNQGLSVLRRDLRLVLHAHRLCEASRRTHRVQVHCFGEILCLPMSVEVLMSFEAQRISCRQRWCCFQSANHSAEA